MAPTPRKKKAKAAKKSPLLTPVKEAEAGAKLSPNFARMVQVANSAIKVAGSAIKDNKRGRNQAMNMAHAVVAPHNKYHGE